MRKWKRRSYSFIVRKQKKREAKLLRRRKRHITKYVPLEKLYRENPNNRDVLKRLFPNHLLVKAPETFSLIKNENSTLDFLAALNACYERGQKALVMLNNVKELTTDAVLVLLSNLVKFQTANIDFNGTKPKNRAVRKKLEESGFFKYLYSDVKITDRDLYTFKQMDNHLYTHGQKTVASEEADRLVMFASQTVWGEKRRCQGVQKTLLELMHNTFDHAGISKGDKHWWLSVEHDNANKEVVFSFIDFGVGIFRSLQNKTPEEPLYGAWDYILQTFPWAKSQEEKLKLILEGKVRLTQSKDYYRGKGLAKIYSMYKHNMISSLTIISNNASFNGDTNDYHLIKDEFKGTFVSFKINCNTKSLTWTI